MWIHSIQRERIASGQIMTQTFATHRRPSSRAATALMFTAGSFVARRSRRSALLSTRRARRRSAMPRRRKHPFHPTIWSRRRRSLQRRMMRALTYFQSGCSRTSCRAQYRRSAGHRHHRYRQHRALLRARAGPRHSLRRRCRPRGIHLVRRTDHQPQGGVAGLASAARK